MSPGDRARDRAPIERGHGARSHGPLHDRAPGTVGHGGAQSETKIEIDREALRAEIANRLTSALADSSRRAQARVDTRQQFVRRRKVGLQQRHAAKLARPGCPSSASGDNGNHVR